MIIGSYGLKVARKMRIFRTLPGVVRHLIELIGILINIYPECKTPAMEECVIPAGEG